MSTRYPVLYLDSIDSRVRKTKDSQILVESLADDTAGRLLLTILCCGIPRASISKGALFVKSAKGMSKISQCCSLHIMLRTE